MKRKIFTPLLVILILTLSICFLVGCKDDAQVRKITISEWLDAEGEIENYTLTVTVTSIINTALASVTDGTTSINLFGLIVDGQPVDILSSGIEEGDTLVLTNGIFNQYGESIEMKDAVLLISK